MAGFEVIVRPAILPDIRPRPKQSLPPQDDPEKGFAVIKGNPASAAGFSSSSSVSISYSRPTETERRVDDVRVYQKDDDGTVNKDNFIDLQVANRITMNEGSGPESKPEAPGALSGGTISEERVYYYQPVEEADNIEIKKHNHIVRSDQGAAEE